MECHDAELENHLVGTALEGRSISLGQFEVAKKEEYDTSCYGELILLGFAI